MPLVHTEEVIPLSSNEQVSPVSGHLVANPVHGAQALAVVAARHARDAGLAVTELHTSWLDTPLEEAVIQARVEIDHEAERSGQINDAVAKTLDALRSNSG
jgi:hypothetical protein